MEAARLLYDRREAARQLSISVRGLDYIIAAKELDTRRIGRKVLVTGVARPARGRSRFLPPQKPIPTTETNL
jgi:hypothetical protein